jgi:hypothetical protein
MRSIKAIIKTTSISMKIAVAGAAAGVLAGGALLWLSLHEGSVRSDADKAEAAARETLETKLRADVRAEAAARTAAGAATLKTATDHTNSSVRAEAEARENVLADERSAWQRAVADEPAARQQAILNEASARAQGFANATAERQKGLADEAAAREKGRADEAAARQQAFTDANRYTDTAVAREATARQASIATLQAGVNTATTVGEQSAASATSSARQYADSVVAAEATARQASVANLQSALTAGDAATLASANQYTDTKISGLQIYPIRVTIDIPFADAPTFYSQTLTCNPGDFAVGGGVSYDPATLKTGAPDTQTGAGVIASAPSEADSSLRTWVWTFRNTAPDPGGTKTATITLLCLRRTA